VPPVLEFWPDYGAAASVFQQSTMLEHQRTKRSLRLSFRLIRDRSWPFTIDRITTDPGALGLSGAYSEAAHRIFEVTYEALIGKTLA
jgi:hypothetical protein